jgi:hypothetical protein
LAGKWFLLRVSVANSRQDFRLGKIYLFALLFISDMVIFNIMSKSSIFLVIKAFVEKVKGNNKKKLINERVIFARILNQ